MRVRQEINPSESIPVDRRVSEVSPDDYDALILPGGAVNPDKLRVDREAVGFVREFCESGKPVGGLRADRRRVRSEQAAGAPVAGDSSRAGAGRRGDEVG